MNAAARLVHQSGLSRYLLYKHFLTKRQITVLCIACAVLLSALSIVYITQVTRVLHASYQANLAEKNKLKVQHDQLLLERSTWVRQARIRQVAENKLGMIAPDYKSVIVINENE